MTPSVLCCEWPPDINACRLIASAAAAAFTASKACGTLLGVPVAVLMEVAAAIRYAARLVSATAAVRHG